jgi:arylsulfatase A-like enzyme
VLIVADSLRYDAVHRGGDHRLPYTVAHGVSFHQARSAGCWTLPATAGMFSGLLPHEHGATSQTRGIRPDIPTLAERMKALGYTTCMVSANIVTTDIFGLHRGFDRVDCIWQLAPPLHKQIHTVLVLAGKPRLRRKLCSVDFILGKLSRDLEAAKVWLQSTMEVVFARTRDILQTAQTQGQRVFCFLNLMETHFPYHVANTFETTIPGLWGKCRELYSLYHLVNQTWLIRNKPYIAPDMLQSLQQRQRQAWMRLAPVVDATIRELREHYGALVVFGADHGDNFGDQGWQYHFSNVTDAGTRVPLFWLPHDRDEARTIHLPVSSRDLFGSILQAAGDRDPTLFSLVDTPERSITIMQAYWYNNRGRTLPCFRYNQFAFVAQAQRFVHRQQRWYTAPITRTDQGEAPFQRLPQGVHPLGEQVDDPERLAYVRRAFDAYEAFAARL